jgi:hypothetical protein
MWASVWIGLLFTLMMLTKTTALFLLPALGWAMLLPMWSERRRAIQCALIAAGTFAATFGLWMAIIASAGLMRDYNYLFFINKYIKPTEFYWPLLSLWWSFHGGLWIDRILIPLAGVIVLGAIAAWKLGDRQRGRDLLFDPVFGASLWAIAGYILFMTYQNHPQPRYFAVVAFFCFFIVARGANALMEAGGSSANAGAYGSPARWMGWAVIGIAAVAALSNAAATLNFAAHPEYTWVEAAQRLTQYIDAHPNGNRRLVSISGDEITLTTHLPSICDDFGTQDLVSKLGRYQPGWWATWNDIDPGTLEDLHNRYSLEQVASFHAFDDPERNVLVLFKLHPLPGGQIRNPSEMNLQVILPDDKVGIPIQ